MTFAFNAHFYRLIIRSQLTESLELFLTISFVSYSNYPQGVVPALCMQLITLVDFEILVRKRVVGFIERLKISKNLIIRCIDNSWKIKFDIWNPWIKLLYK